METMIYSWLIILVALATFLYSGYLAVFGNPSKRWLRLLISVLSFYVGSAYFYLETFTPAIAFFGPSFLRPAFVFTWIVVLYTVFTTRAD